MSKQITIGVNGAKIGIDVPDDVDQSHAEAVALAAFQAGAKWAGREFLEATKHLTDKSPRTRRNGRSVP